MKKNISLVMLGFFVFALFNLLAQAQGISQAAAMEAKAPDAGNKICPVSGEKIKEEMKSTYEYKGKIYNFCCPMCIDEFKKDPEKYIAKVDEELNSTGAVTPTAQDEESAQQEGGMHHQGHAH